MSAPHLSDPRDTANTLDGMAETARRLITDFGFTITWATLDDDHGAYDGDTRIITINPDSSIVDQCCALIDYWRLCAIGPEAAPDLQRDPDQPRLRAVP